MSRHSVQVFLGVTLGSLIGSLTSLWLFSELNIWGLITSAVVGGFTAYLIVDFEAVLKAIPLSAHLAWQKTSSAFQWRPSAMLRLRTKLTLKLLPTTLLLMTMASFWVIAVVLTITTLITLADPSTAPNLSLFVDFLLVLYAIMMLLMSIMTAITSFNVTDDVPFKLLRTFARDKNNFQEVNRLLNPFTVLFYWLPKGLLCLLQSLPTGIYLAILYSCWFVWFLFRAIHSDLRLICLVDAALFASTGYLSGSPYLALLISIAAGAFGVFNYAVIGKRWLGTLPTEA